MANLPFHFGDLILVQDTFSSDPAKKFRPAVVISHRDINSRRPDIIFMPISSQVRDPLRVGEVLVVHWREAGLDKLSVIKPVIGTEEKKNVTALLGKLKTTDRQALEQMLTQVLIRY